MQHLIERRMIIKKISLTAGPVGWAARTEDVGGGGMGGGGEGAKRGANPEPAT